MSQQPGRKVEIKIGAVSIRGFSNTSTYERSADVYDVTVYGQDDKAFQGGTRTGTYSVEGIYETGAANTPRALFDGQEGATVTIVDQPEGNNVGSPSRSFAAVIKTYTESRPVADMVKWTCAFQPSGAVTRTTL